MSNFKKGAAALIAATMLAGPAGAGANWVPAEIKIGSISKGAAAGAFAATFGGWTLYRFFQNCGPFRC